MRHLVEEREARHETQCKYQNSRTCDIVQK